ncbi:hypothetical protein ACROYT_G043793 [Oculina patagonica]
MRSQHKSWKNFVGKPHRSSQPLHCLLVYSCYPYYCSFVLMPEDFGSWQKGRGYRDYTDYSDFARPWIWKDKQKSNKGHRATKTMPVNEGRNATRHKVHECKHCDRVFRFFYLLKRHEQTHTGIKQYACKYCDKHFRLSSTCKTHERRHTGEKPYACKHCQKCFIDSGTCKRHEQRHSGIKQYGCKHCGYTNEHIQERSRIRVVIVKSALSPHHNARVTNEHIPVRSLMHASIATSALRVLERARDMSEYIQERGRMHASFVIDALSNHITARPMKSDTHEKSLLNESKMVNEKNILRNQLQLIVVKLLVSVLSSFTEEIQAKLKAHLLDMTGQI